MNTTHTQTSWTPLGIGLVILALCAIIGLPAAQAQSDQPDRYGPGGNFDAFFDDYIANRLELGLRYVRVSLRDKDRRNPDRENYLGSIDHLDEQQPHAPYPVVYYYFNSYLGLTVTYDRFGAVTLKRVKPRVPSNTDGTLYARGPVICVRGRYPNNTIFTPYAEAGLAFYRGRFKRDHEWAHTLAHREMEVGNDTAPVWATGVDIEITPHWHIELYARYARVDIDGRFYRNYREEPRRGNFKLDHYAYGGGVKYAF